MNKIDHFVGRYAFLSNFHPSCIRFGGKLYRTVEHAYQCAKTRNIAEQDRILIRRESDSSERPTTPGEAKRAGRQVTLRADWDTAKVDVMRELLILKFESPRLADLLIETGDAELIESNTWGDTFWGVCNGKGDNCLGKLLMEIREALR